ncbi:TPA: 3'-5' exonuclease [Escherichia coli]|nr:3'-5' exonuclease [Escherichia coli]
MESEDYDFMNIAELESDLDIISDDLQGIFDIEDLEEYMKGIDYGYYINKTDFVYVDYIIEDPRITESLVYDFFDEIKNLYSDRKLELIQNSELYKKIKSKMDETADYDVERISEIVYKYQTLASNGFFVLDTETTDLNGEVVSFALIDEKNNILINEFCKPIYNKISKTAESIHHISNEMIKNGRNIIDIYEDFLKIINSEENKNKPIFIYNEEFDIATIYRSLNFAKYEYKEIDEKGNNDFDNFELRTHCVMKDFAKFYGDFDDDYCSYNWKKLEFAANYFGVKTDNLELHNSAVDCYLTLEVIKNMRDFFNKE